MVTKIVRGCHSVSLQRRGVPGVAPENFNEIAQRLTVKIGIVCKPKFCRNLLIFQYFKNNCADFARLYLRKEAPDYAQIFRINPLDHTQDAASEKIQKIETLFFDPLNPDCHLKKITRSLGKGTPV